MEAKSKGLKTWEVYYDEDERGKFGTFSSEELRFPQRNDPIFEDGLSDNSEEEDSYDNDDDADDDGDRVPGLQVRTAKGLYNDSDLDSDSDGDDDDDDDDEEEDDEDEDEDKENCTNRSTRPTRQCNT